MSGESSQVVRPASVKALRQYAPACDFRTELGKEVGEEEGPQHQVL